MTGKPKQVGGQVEEELHDMMTIVEDYSVSMDFPIHKYLEIGCREGYALRRLVTCLDSIDTVLAIDWPGQEWGKLGSEVELNRNLDYLRSEYGMTATLWLGDSRSPEARNAAEELGPWDLCLIDASHYYEDVLSDFNTYGPLSKIIVLHDINHPPDSKAYGPTKLWNEIVDSGRYRTRAIIAPGSRKGLGVIFND